MTLVVSEQLKEKLPVEIFVISFLIFIVVSAALAIGVMLGRGPIHGRCHPDEDGGCAETGNCAVRCTKRRLSTTDRET